jgi:hypothetical protein
MCELVAEELPELVAEGTSIDCGVIDMAEVIDENFIVIVVVTVICVMSGDVVEGSLVKVAAD